MSNLLINILSSIILGSFSGETSQLSIYILKLEGGKFYLGLTSNLARCVEMHNTGKFCNWTVEYKPLSIIDNVEVDNKHGIETLNNFIEEYMLIHGIDQVRGGKYRNFVLTNDEVETLQSKGIFY